MMEINGRPTAVRRHHTIRETTYSVRYVCGNTHCSNLFNTISMYAWLLFLSETLVLDNCILSGFFNIAVKVSAIGVMVISPIFFPVSVTVWPMFIECSIDFGIGHTVRANIWRWSSSIDAFEKIAFIATIYLLFIDEYTYLQTLVYHPVLPFRVNTW